MTSGAGHYRAAELLLDRAAGGDGVLPDKPDQAVMIAAAQVHATLAVAAAQIETAVQSATAGMTRADDWHDWLEALS